MTARTAVARLDAPSTRVRKPTRPPTRSPSSAAMRRAAARAASRLGSATCQEGTVRLIAEKQRVT